MKKLFLFAIFVSCLFSFTSLSIFAEESDYDISTFAFSDSLDSLTTAQRAKFEDLIYSSSGSSNFAVWYLVNNGNLVWSYDFVYDSSTNIATIGERHILRPDGSTGVLYDETTNNVIDSTNVQYLLFKYDYTLIHGSEFLPDSSTRVACPVALNEVLANDYISSLVTYVYRANVENFIIYRVQHTQDVTDLASINTTIRQVGEIKGYVLTTLSNVVQTFVIDSNQPTIYQINEGQEYFIYMDLLDPDYVDDWTMVLHSDCLDRSYSSEMEAIGSVNESIVTTISQNSTIISQNESLIEQNEITNNLINSGNQQSQEAGEDLFNSGYSLGIALGEVDNLENSALSNFRSNLNSINFDFSNFVSLSSFSLIGSLMTYILDYVYTPYLFIISISFILFFIGRLRK